MAENGRNKALDDGKNMRSRAGKKSKGSGQRTSSGFREGVTLYLVNLTEHDSSVELLRHRAEELILDYCDVEAFLSGEGVIPFPPNPALVQ